MDLKQLGQQALSLHQSGRLAEALACYDQLLVLKPDHVGALNNRASILLGQRRFAEALSSFDAAARLRPDAADIHANRGNVLASLKRRDEARAAFDAALAINPDLVAALRSRAELAWTHFRDYPATHRDLEHLVAIAPDFDYAQGDLLHLKMHGGDWRTLDRDMAALDAGVRAGRRIVRPYVYQALSHSPADLQRCSVIHADHLYPPAPQAPIAPRNHARIRIAYMSGELRENAVSLLMAGLFEKHDRNRFEVIALDNGFDDGSALRRRLEKAFDRIIPISQLSDSAVADLIRAEEIDILVDLNGVFGAVRMEVMATRPAPLQVSYMGTPNTLGTSYYDYLIADDCVIPPAEQRFFCERIASLPDTYWVNDDQRPIADTVPTRAECGLPDLSGDSAGKAFVFCNFNQSYKLTPQTFDSWCRILDRVPGSVLWLWESNTVFSANLRREAAVRNLDPARLVFAPAMPPDRHLARLKLADLSLDGLPYNAHTTASDVLWAGVPIVTCRGATFPGRVAASLLHAIHLPELVAEDAAAFENLAVALAQDPARLGILRAKLAANRLTTPLFDTARWTRAVEAAFTTMWDIHSSGEAPRSFKLPPEAAISGP